MTALKANQIATKIEEFEQTHNVTIDDISNLSRYINCPL
jgi:hypothetical protein